MMFKNALFIGAHPDDVEMNAGGMVRKIVTSGGKATILCLTGSDARKNESRLACMALGTQDMLFLDGKDTLLADDTARLIRATEMLITNLHPDVVFTHFHADTHQDHVAAYKIAVAAARNVRNFLMFKPTYPSGRPDIPFHPTIISLMSAGDMEAKTTAINCFASQRLKYGDARWALAMEAVARGDAWTYGGVHGFAEVFQAGRLTIE